MREIKVSDKVTGAKRLAAIEAARRKVKDGQLYFVWYNGGFFNSGAWYEDVAEAGLFTAEHARQYLGYTGVSVVPLKYMREVLIARAAELSKKMEAIRKMLYP